MTLNEWFAKQPKGTKTRMAEELGITLNWLLQICNLGKEPSADLARKISKYTNRKVRVMDLISEG